MKAIKSLLAFILVMALSFGVKAQDKYEYSSVVFESDNAHKAYVYISQDGKFEERSIEIKEGGRMGANLCGALSVINKMSESGWEVYSTNEYLDRMTFFHLRRKKG